MIWNDREPFPQFTVPSAVVLTVNAYAMFSRIPEVSKAIEEFIGSSKLSDMADLKRASEKCVSAISDVALPESIQKLVSIKNRRHDFATRSQRIVCLSCFGRVNHEQHDH